MIESADHLVHKHFGKLLADEGVEILDPCTGTGTYITELIEYLPPHKLEHKYQHEIHCNEMAILPYYIANLNIEFTYAQKMGKYEEFKNICLVDTLDHCGFEGKQFNLFAMSVQNTARIQNQNDRKISVIIGNPPYNAWQENFNQNNANRPYADIDKRLKATYVKYGTAQNKISVYDMYTRFYRWASDRVEEGIICFITNSSFLNSRAFDGFRKSIKDEFSYAYFIDCGGNVREISGRDGIFICEKHTIFGEAAMTGIVIGFLIKTKSKSNCQIFYSHPFDIHELRENKIKFIAETPFQSFPFDHILPDKKNNWINQTDNDFDSFLPLINKEVKAGKSEEAIFKLFSAGVKTQRDEWVYDFSRDALIEKVTYLVDAYIQQLNQGTTRELDIKWDAETTQYIKRKIAKNFEENQIINSLYRPYIKQYLYFDRHFNGRTYQMFNIFPVNNSTQNFVINFTTGVRTPFSVLGMNCLSDLNFYAIEPAQCLPLYRYDEKGDRIDNITDWGLTQFQSHYQDSKITKENIFHYTYAVLHHPAYHTKYELNLKREFPRLPFYQDFHQWTNWGKTLMKLHLNYETIQPYGLQQVEIATKENPKAKLKADKINGVIILDDNTQLIGVNAIAWEYKLGNRSALEWILDQYKEKKPKDPTIAKLFNTYKFADYKEQVIDLLQRVCTVSVKTMETIQKMP
jgi:predicted helicase